MNTSIFFRCSSFICLCLIGLILSSSAAASSDCQFPSVYQRGNAPLVITSPHDGGNELLGVLPREGIGISDFVTSRDNHMNELVDEVVRNLNVKPYVVKAQVSRVNVDLNREDIKAFEDAEGEKCYLDFHDNVKKALAEINRRWGRDGYLLDFHAQGRSVNSIYRGTQNGSSLNPELADEFAVGEYSLFAYIARQGIDVKPKGTEQEVIFKGGFITREYGFKNKDLEKNDQLFLNSAQIEVGSNLKDTSAERKELGKRLAYAIEAHMKDVGFSRSLNVYPQIRLLLDDQ